MTLSFRTSLTLIVVLGLSVSAVGETKRPYPVDHKAPLQPKAKIVAKASDHVKWRVEFNGIRADRVPAFLYAPAKPSSRPAVLLQYGTGGSKRSRYIVAFGKLFAEAGFTVLTIDSPQRGERRTKGSKDNLLNQIQPKRFAQYCGDYSRAIDYLTSRKDVDAKRIGYVGISWGAVTGVTFAAHDKRIKTVASIVGGGGFGKVLGQKQSKGKAKFPSVDPADHVGFIAPRPLLMLNVTNDWLIPRPFSTALHRAAGAGGKVVWLETDHKFTTVDRKKMMRSVIQFMAKGLGK